MAHSQTAARGDSVGTGNGGHWRDGNEGQMLRGDAFAKQ